MKPLDPTSARKILQEILARDEYQAYYNQNKHKDFGFLSNISEWFKEVFSNLFTSMNDWLDPAFKKLFPKTDIPQGVLSTTSYVFVVIGIVLIIFLLHILWTRFVSDRKSSKKKAIKITEINLPNKKLLEEADNYANAGDFQTALRKIFLIIIKFLNQANLIEAKKWKTNFEYYEEINDRDSYIAQTFYVLAIKFDEVMYGGRSINMEDYLSFRQQVNKWVNDKQIKLDDSLDDLGGGS